MIKLSKLLYVTSAVTSLLLVSACGGQYNNYSTDNPDPMDRPADLNRDDFIKALSPRPTPEVKVEVKEPPLPKLINNLTPPKPPKIASDKTVSITVTEDIQLKDIFLELSRQADIDIEVASNIRGGIIFKATNRPVSEVVQRITEMANLRYTVNNGVLRIERDENFVESYPVNFLNIIRKNTSKIESSSKIESGSGSSGSGSSTGGTSSSESSEGGNGSESSITTDSGGDGDIWKSIESQLSSILGTQSASSGGAAAGGAPAPVAAPQGPNAKFVSISREAGLITVSGNSKDHAKVKQYIDQVKGYYSSQVLIEAKVVEVSLNDEFRSGVDWEIFTKSINSEGVNKGVKFEANFGASSLPSFAAGSNSISISGLGGGDINNSVITLGQVFGTTRTLSSPRILAMNNQQAILSFATNETYFSIDCSTTDAVLGDGNTVVTPAKVNITSKINTVPVGIILNIQNSIDVKGNQVTMNVRPTLSRLTGVTTEDPATTICIANAKAQAGDNADQIPDIKSIIPQVDVRQLDSILTLKSGEVMAIGGMIEQKNINNDSGVPYASEIPIFGNAFKSVDKRNNAVQTVIFLKATIVPAYGVDSFDQNLYNKFNTDPRPFKF